MEEMLELILVLIVAGIGIASKSNKKKKKAQQPAPPKATAWDEMDARVEQRFTEFMEDREGEPMIPYAPSQPHQPGIPPVQPAVPQAQILQPQPVPVPAAVQPAKTVQSVEGMPVDFVVAPPAPRPVKKPRPAQEPEAPMQTMHVRTRSAAIPERLSSASLRSAVIMSEVLGKPVALRNTARR